MIEIKFRDFYDQRYPAIEHYELYVLLNGTGDALYVGISRQDIWQRWFGYEGHLFFDGKHIHGQSQVGQKVADQFPNSLEWKIQLWTHSDCARCCQDVLPTEHGAN